MPDTWDLCAVFVLAGIFEQEECVCAGVVVRLKYNRNTFAHKHVQIHTRTCTQSLPPKT